MEINAHQNVAAFIALQGAAGQSGKCNSKSSDSEQLRRKFDELNRRRCRRDHKTSSVRYNLF